MPNETTGALPESERKLAPQVTRTQILALVMAKLEHDENGAGLCLGCGADAEGAEPDARNLPCDACGSLLVFGLEEILLRYAL